MDHTHIVRASDLESYADRRESQSVIPELVYLLVKQSVSEISVCRIPYGDAVNQPGLDGLVETEQAFLEFVPKGKSYWEIGTGADPQSKATGDFRKRTKELSVDEKASSSFVFVTPRSSGSGGWDEPRQRKWLTRRKTRGWKRISIIDGVKLSDWLREFPALGRWMALKIGLTTRLRGFTTPSEHWDLIRNQVAPSDPPLPQTVFIVGRENACTALQNLFEGKSHRLFFFAESPRDVEDFVAAYLNSLDEAAFSFSNRCLFISDEDAWRSIVETTQPHVLIADPALGLDADKADLIAMANQKGHSVIIPVCGAWSGENPEIIKLRSPSSAQIEKALTDVNFPQVRARELAGVGADRLSALRRYLLGFGGLPPYASWENARALAQAGLVGKWDGNNPADRAALEILLGKNYGEWMEPVRSDALRMDTPLIQKDEKWRVVARGEAWDALGPRLSDNDLDQFKQTALKVLSEYDPKFDLPKEERYAAAIHGKMLEHSTALREGISETLALLGSRPKALSSCSSNKAEFIPRAIVRELLDGANWERWASLEPLLPLLAEAAPNEVLDAFESALEDLENSPFHQIFAQEGSGGIGGWNYISGILWALENLAWNPNLLARVVLILGDLSAIDPGGNWANRPSNSLRDILLPWHPQTTASIEKRKIAVETLLHEQPEIGWNLLIALLPHSHGVTSGCHKPVWQKFISADWSGVVTEGEYWQQENIYADMAIEAAKSDVGKLVRLIGDIAELPRPAFDKLLAHLKSEEVIRLPENERLPIWEHLDDLVRKHRKFSDTQWALPEDILVKVDGVAEALAVRTPALRFHHLFSGRDFDLYDGRDDFEEQRKRLDVLRQNALQEILDSGGVDAVMAFAQSVSSPRHIGITLGNIATDSVDSVLLPMLLDSEDEIQKDLISSFVASKHWKDGWDWADKMLANDWMPSYKARFLTFLPFNSDTWKRVDEVLGGEENLYWQKVPVNPWGSDENFDKAAEKLITYGRPNAAIHCFGHSPGLKGDFDAELATRALLAVLESGNVVNEFDANATVEVITKLQDNPSTDKDALFVIEWNFLSLLGRFSTGSPKTLEQRLASTPSFFCEVIGLVFLSTKEEVQEEPTEQQQQLARNAYKLLDSWQMLPGKQLDGSFDPDAFKAWLEEMKHIASDTGHLEIALSQLGHVLIHAPEDEDGLWIHRIVAQALNGKDAKSMRRGYRTAVINSRGAHWVDPTGKPELELSEQFSRKAESVEAAGFQRFAVTLRDIAEEYKKEAERVISDAE